MSFIFCSPKQKRFFFLLFIYIYIKRKKKCSKWGWEIVGGERRGEERSRFVGGKRKKFVRLYCLLNRIVFLYPCINSNPPLLAKLEPALSFVLRFKFGQDKVPFLPPAHQPTILILGRQLRGRKILERGFINNIDKTEERGLASFHPPPAYQPQSSMFPPTSLSHIFTYGDWGGGGLLFFLKKNYIYIYITFAPQRSSPPLLFHKYIYIYIYGKVGLVRLKKKRSWGG